MSRKPRTPAKLATAGRRLWQDVTAAYELSRHELALLAEAGGTLDAVEALEAAVAEEGPTTAGSRGQVTVNPALAELRQQRLAFARLLAQLALPDPSGNVIRSPRQVRAQRAAQAQWRARHRAEGA